MTPLAVSILGLGLIGGSLGLALARRPDFAARRTGYDADPRVGRRAIEREAVEEVAGSPAEAVRGADLVIVAAPVLAIGDLFQAIAPHLPAGSTVTDTASTKSLVLDQAARWLPETADFVAGHPMAGREIQGIDGAQGDLFQGCTYCIIPAAGASPDAIRRVSDLAEAVGGRPLEVGAEEHDRAAAGISHLPLLISAALTGCTTSSPEWPLMRRLAAGGYRDVSRLASGDPRMGRDISLSNAAALIDWIDRFTAELNDLRNLIERGDPAIEARLLAAKKSRDAWLNDAQRV